MTTPRRLLFVYTGGTLGMVQTDAGWAPGADLKGWLDDLVGREFAGTPHDFVQLDPLIDSSNVTPVEWQRILDVIDGSHTTHDAFVVLHGTDTMGYTAAALSFALSGSGVPVVLTGAQRSLVQRDSDAPNNVRNAIRCALDERLTQVAIFFDDRLIIGHHASKISTTDDHAFESMNAAPLAQLVGDDLVFTPDETLPTPSAPADLKPFVEADVVVVTLHPGLQASRLRAQLTPPPQAIVLRAYGSGNAPSDDPELMAALTEATEAGAVLVVTTQCPHGRVQLGQYAASQPLLAAGAVAGGDYTTDALVAWLTFLVSQGMSADEIKQVMTSADA